MLITITKMLPFIFFMLEFAHNKFYVSYRLEPIDIRTPANDKPPENMTIPKNSVRLTRELEMCYSSAGNKTSFRQCASKLWEDCKRNINRREK